MKTALILICTAFCPWVCAAPWTNTEGKTIEADYLRMNGDKVVLKMENRTVEIPMERLNADSQAFARHMEQALQKWAETAAAAPYLTGQILHELVEYNPVLVDGKNYVICCQIESFKKTGSGVVAGTSAQFDVTLRGGLVIPMDFAERVKSRSARLKVEDDRVVLEIRRQEIYDKLVEYRIVDTLIRNGRLQNIKVDVKQGMILNPTIVTEAESENLGRMYRWDLHMERMQARLTYLEARLAGTLADAASEKTPVQDDADHHKAAIRQEILTLHSMIQRDRKQIRY